MPYVIEARTRALVSSKEQDVTYIQALAGNVAKGKGTVTCGKYGSLEEALLAAGAANFVLEKVIWNVANEEGETTRRAGG